MEQADQLTVVVGHESKGNSAQINDSSLAVSEQGSQADLTQQVLASDEELKKSSPEQEPLGMEDAAELVTPAMLEALLVASGAGLTLEELSTTIGAASPTVEGALTVLQARYEGESFGIELKQVAGRYQIRTKEEFASLIRKLKTETPRRLSAQALETLAIIAYRQPVARSEVEKLRGVDVAPTIKTLLERGLIRIVGTQPTPGSPALFGTTEEFLKVFGLQSLEQLPSIRDLHELSKEPGEQAAN